MDIVTASPPVSPRVVARILMIQKPSMTSGTLLDRGALLLAHDAWGNGSSCE